MCKVSLFPASVANKDFPERFVRGVIVAALSALCSAVAPACWAINKSGTSPGPSLTAGAAVAFTPGGALPLVLTVIESAHDSLDVAAYSFTSPKVVDALRKAAHRRVAVRLLVDERDNLGNGNGKKSKIAMATLLSAGVKIRSDARYAIHHNKFIIADARSVQTGSFNYTQAAAVRNAENVLVVWNHAGVASSYRREFQRLWGESKDVTFSRLAR